MASKRKLIEMCLYMSLIGREIEVVDAANPNLNGIKGIVCNETANMFVIKVREGVFKKVIKKCASYVLRVEGKTLKINGELLSKDLISRIKRLK